MRDAQGYQYYSCSECVEMVRACLLCVCGLERVRKGDEAT